MKKREVGINSWTSQLCKYLFKYLDYPKEIRNPWKYSKKMSNRPKESRLSPFANKVCKCSFGSVHHVINDSVSPKFLNQVIK